MGTIVYDVPERNLLASDIRTISRRVYDSLELAGSLMLRWKTGHAQGQPVAVQMLNCVIAAFSRVGNLARAFETFDAASGLGLTPDTDSYNAIMEGLVSHGQAAALPKVLSSADHSSSSPPTADVALGIICSRNVACVGLKLRA